MLNLQSTIDIAEQISDDFAERAEYQAELESCSFDMRDALLKMQEDSEKETTRNHRIQIIELIVTLLTLAVSVVSLVFSVF